MVAALFVESAPRGVYQGLSNVDPWDAGRDARSYAGPWAVVAHPPCARWGNFWYGGPLLHKQGRRKTLGDDGGCFAAAVAAVRTWGGVLEHPAYSRAWPAFNIPRPPSLGHLPDGSPFWTVQVEQGHYGHRAPKKTWLFGARCMPPPMEWGPSSAVQRVSGGHRHRTASVERMGHYERMATPVAFRDLLIGIAESVRP